MKKVTSFILLVCAAFAFMGCASEAQSRITRAQRNAPDDVLVGIGNAKLNSIDLSKTIAATRARAELSNAINSIVRDMLRDYMAASEVDSQEVLGFQESLTVRLSQSNLSGAVIVEELTDKDGSWWCVMYLSKEEISKEIVQAQVAARLAFPAADSFDTEARLNTAFARQVNEMRGSRR